MIIAVIFCFEILYPFVFSIYIIIPHFAHIVKKISKKIIERKDFLCYNIIGDKMDYLIKALALNNQVRVYLVQNKEVVNEAIKRHDLWPSASLYWENLNNGVNHGAMLKGMKG